MVHLWISLINEKLMEKRLGKKYKCLKSNIEKICQKRKISFFGDNEFQIYLGSKHDYLNLHTFSEKIIQNSNDWMRNCKLPLENISNLYYLNSFYKVFQEFGHISEKNIKLILPKKETFDFKNILIYRLDGNFKLISVETSRFFYLFSFATS